MIDANEIECYIDETKVDREECIRDVTNSPKDWEDFWYSPEAQGTWDLILLRKYGKPWTKLNHSHPQQTNEFRPQKTAL